MSQNVVRVILMVLTRQKLDQVDGARSVKTLFSMAAKKQVLSDNGKQLTRPKLEGRLNLNVV